MREYCLILLIPLAVWAGRSPAAVFEDVYELGRPNASFLATTESWNGMKAYLRKKYRQMQDPLQQASMIAAYTAAHERYQNSEEKQHDRVRIENMGKLASVRTKRLGNLPLAVQNSKMIDIVPREMIKFELSDAVAYSFDYDSPLHASHRSKSRTKREKQEKRMEPIPREILRFEISDAVVSKLKNNANSTTSIRHRRSASPDPRDYFKFELEDAKTPNGYANAKANVTENLRHPFTSSDIYRRGKVFDEAFERPKANVQKNEATKKEKRESIEPMDKDDASDMSSEESRRIKITGKKQKQSANYEDLPIGIQKAIDIAIKANEHINGKGGDTILKTAALQSTSKYFFGDKKPKTKNSLITTPKPNINLSYIEQPVVEETSNGQTDIISSNPLETGSGTISDTNSLKNTKHSSLQGIPKTWWSFSDLQRPKRLYQKVPLSPLAVSSQYVNTFKPSIEQSKMNELSPGYHRQQDLFSPVTSSNTEPAALSDLDSYRTSVSIIPQEVIIKERPKIQYVIKDIPVSKQMKQQRTKITMQPSILISYGQDISNPRKESVINRTYDIVYGPTKVEYGHRKPIEEPVHSFQNMKVLVPDYKEESHTQHYFDSNKNNQIFETEQPSSVQLNEFNSSQGNIAALSALIGQQPNAQLKGLNQLLHTPLSMTQNDQQHRPQDSTAPVTFPETSTMTPKPFRPSYRSIQVNHESNIIYDDNYHHALQIDPHLQFDLKKEYTPIQEETTDVSDSEFKGPVVATANYASNFVESQKPIQFRIAEHQKFNEAEAGHETNTYRHIKGHSPPDSPNDKSTSRHYLEQHHTYHDSRKEHYDVINSEGYAFGYRVRDFHTGNDFGHIQNHDNGVTRGEYHTLLPDGRVQNVRYTADAKGFHADVSYESVHSSSHSSK
uniref:Uncharacterized protein n=1 Tax=Anopheles coluzzii TaxID=1518534 RepID=A0A6E8W7J4_ANOCL